MMYTRSLLSCMDFHHLMVFLLVIHEQSADQSADHYLFYMYFITYAILCVNCHEYFPKERMLANFNSRSWVVIKALGPQSKSDWPILNKLKVSLVDTLSLYIICNYVMWSFCNTLCRRSHEEGNCYKIMVSKSKIVWVIWVF